MMVHIISRVFLTSAILVCALTSTANSSAPDDQLQTEFATADMDVLSALDSNTTDTANFTIEGSGAFFYVSAGEP